MKTLPILICLCFSASAFAAKKVVSRGASAVHVASKISNNALVLGIR